MLCIEEIKHPILFDHNKRILNMKILHYISSFSLPSETFIYDLINNLEDKGIDNYILTHHRELEGERPFEKINITSENTSLIRKIYYKLFSKWKIRNEKYVIEYIHKVNPDIIHAHFGPNGVRIYNLIKKYNLNIPLVISFHGMDINVLPLIDKVYVDYLLQLNKDKNILFTSPSGFLKNKMILLGLDDNLTSVIPNAYNSYFENVKKEKYWQYGDTLKLLNIGRFEEVKGQKYLIEAFSNILKEYPDTTLTLVGYGSLEKELKNLCKSLNVVDKVIFLRQIEHSKLPKLIVAHDIYIQPSIVASDGSEESLGVSTIEAQVCGLPAIASKIGGLNEIVIDNITGKIVDQKDIENIKDEVMFYVNNSDIMKKHAINAIIKAENNFNKEVLINTLKNIYFKLKNENVKQT